MENKFLKKANDHQQKDYNYEKQVAVRKNLPKHSYPSSKPNTIYSVDEFCDQTPKRLLSLDNYLMPRAVAEVIYLMYTVHHDVLRAPKIDNDDTTDNKDDQEGNVEENPENQDWSGWATENSIVAASFFTPPYSRYALQFGYANTTGFKPAEQRVTVVKPEPFNDDV